MQSTRDGEHSLEQVEDQRGVFLLWGGGSKFDDVIPEFWKVIELVHFQPQFKPTHFRSGRGL